MQIKEIIEFLESFAPLDYQEDWDNSGLIIGNADSRFKGALICLDSTPEVVDECINLGYNLIIAHHPLIFKGLKNINNDTYIGRAVVKAVKNDIAIYAIHTNLDNAYTDGVSAKIAKKIGLKNLELLDPKINTNYIEKFGTGIIGHLPNQMSENDFLLFLKENLNLSCIKYTKMLNKPVGKIAICGGSGSFLLQKAKDAGADVFISADFKYHEFFDSENQILIADIGHYESEIYTIELIYEKLINNFSNFAARLTTVVTNPIKYL
jgi:dinuclear metal center YbgI/SA1388 family protein